MQHMFRINTLIKHVQRISPRISQIFHFFQLFFSHFAVILTQYMQFFVDILQIFHEFAHGFAVIIHHVHIIHAHAWKHQPIHHEKHMKNLHQMSCQLDTKPADGTVLHTSGMVGICECIMMHS